MTDGRKLVPLWVRGVTLTLALANLAYGLIGYSAPGSIFAGLDISSAPAQNAVFQFSARNTAIGVALILVGFVGVPESIAIVMVIRFLIEAQDLVLGMISAAPAPKTLFAAGFMVVEALVIVTMFRIVAKRDAAGR